MAALAQGALVSSVSNVSKEVEGAVENKKISHGIPKDQESECNIYIYIYMCVCVCMYKLNKENSNNTT